MSLYAIGDLHLSFSVDKPMDVFGRVWKNHEKKIWKYWNKRVTDRDTVVVTGDHSWGRNLEQSRKDLEFIAELPGRKILLRGNHDMFWDAKKTQRLNEAFRGRLEFLQNNWFAYEDYALVGTKGYCYEGLDTYEHFEKIRDRELERLRISFEAARMSVGKKRTFPLPLDRRSSARQETGSTSCFCITRLPASGKRQAPLPGWRKPTGPQRWSIPIVMERRDLTTALRAM